VIGLGDGVLPGGGVEHEEHLVGRAGDLLRGDVADLGELLHQVLFGLETAGRVDDEDVGLAGDGGVGGVVDDAAESAPILCLMMSDAQPSPRWRAGRRRRRGSVAGAEDDLLASRLEGLGELGMEVVFPDAVDAADEDDGRTPGAPRGCRWPSRSRRRLRSLEEVATLSVVWISRFL
jgi:hypothetical protein